MTPDLRTVSRLVALHLSLSVAGCGASAGGGGGFEDGGVSVDGSSPSARALRCLGSVAAPASTGGRAAARLLVEELATGASLAGVRVRACAAGDEGCARSLEEAVSDVEGAVRLGYDLGPRGFEGHFELTGGAGDAAVVPTRLMGGVTFTGTTVRRSVFVVSQRTWGLFRAALPATLDASRGVLAALVKDCDERPLAGAVVSLEPAAPSATRFHLRGGVPDRSAGATDRAGIGGFVDVPPGAYTLVATADGRRVGAVRVSVRGGFLNQVDLPPTP